MKALLSACAALALAGALSVPAALAQATAVASQGEAFGLPSGPYLLSCTGAHVANGSLVALCNDRATAIQDRMGAWHTMQMPLVAAWQCNDLIENSNGNLTCETAPRVGSSALPQPYGSAFGTSGPTPGYSGASVNNPYVPPYAVGIPVNRPGPAMGAFGAYGAHTPMPSRSAY
jgi:hypothetical protein